MMSNEAYAKLWGKAGSTTIDALITTLPTTIGRDNHANPPDSSFIPIGDGKTISKHHATLEWSEDHDSFQLRCCSKNGMTVDGTAFGQGEVAALSSRSAIRLGDACIYFLLPTDTHPSMTQQSSVSSDNDATPAGEAEAEADEDGDEREEGDEDEEEEGEDSGMRKMAQDGGQEEQQTGGGGRRSSSRQLTYPEMIARAFDSPELNEKALSEGLLAKEVVTWVLVKYFEDDGTRRQKVQNAVSNYLCKTYEKIASHPSQTRNVRWRKPDGTFRAPTTSNTHNYAQLRGTDESDPEPTPKRARNSTSSQGVVQEEEHHYERLSDTSMSGLSNEPHFASVSSFGDKLCFSASDMMPQIGVFADDHVETEQNS